MKLKNILYFALFGISTILFKRKKPILGTIILTDKCNLSCKHCAVNNITAEIYSHAFIKKQMKQLYEMGIRILFFCGGETLLWKDKEVTLKDLVQEAKQMGFLIVNVVTNGTFPLDVPEADLLLLSLDGNKETHNAIRGDTYDLIIENITQAKNDTICLYMAINKINKNQVKTVCEVAKNTKNIRAISFNFHTPYPGTEGLALTRDEKKEVCDFIAKKIEEGYPIFNLKSAFPYLINNTFKTPCFQCIVMENGRISTCGRCVSIPGLCDKCGYFFAAEYSLLFDGKLSVCFDMLRTYLRYI